MNLPEPFLVKFCADPETGCWDWIAGKSNTGYGSFRYKNRLWNAHKFAYVHLVGEVPDGLEINHLCRNRGCVNPSHMEVGTHADNTRYGFGVAYINVNKTHCDNGHEFTPENTYHRPGHPEWRACRECQRQRNREASQRRYWQNRERKLPSPRTTKVQPLMPSTEKAGGR